MLKSVFLVLLTDLILELPSTACNDCENPDLPMEHGLYVIENVKPKVRNEDYAIGTTPPGFSVRLSTLPNAGLGAFAETTIPANTRLGPYDGIIYRRGFMKKDWHYLWSIYYAEDSDRLYHYVDATPKTHSSWIRYVNMANNIDQENLYVYQYNYEIYYVTFECIKPGTELLVWYGDDYGETLGLNRTQEQYQRRFNISGDQRHRFLNTITCGPVVQYSSKCYKFDQRCPFKKPPHRSENFTKSCLFGTYYDVCKYETCDINPCSGVADCRRCKEYCFYMGKYFKPHQEFEHADNVNVCVCDEDRELVCSGDPSTYRDMCLY